MQLQTWHLLAVALYLPLACCIRTQTPVTKDSSTSSVHSKYTSIHRIGGNQPNVDQAWVSRLASSLLHARPLSSEAKAAPPTGPPTYLTTSNGPVQGYINDGVRVFQGIPFAAPPIGKNRFKRPSAPTPWNVTRQTLQPSPSCPTFELTTTIVLGQEDCLYLDVYIPETSSNTTTTFPTLIWIHGGGFVLGNSYHGGLFDGQHYARTHKVIVVSFNYRLNVFGFLASSVLQRTSADGSTGNFGMQDQRLAMQWVQDNAQELGVDLQRRLLFGQSAGGVSVCYHLTAPASQGLFTTAIMESGSCESAVFFRPLQPSLAFGDLFTTATGCNSTLPDAEYLQCLQTVPTRALMDPLMRDFSPEWPLPRGSTPPPPGVVPPLAPPMPFGPVIDGTPIGLPALPLTLIQQGKWANVPWILGTNNNEGTVFTPLVSVVAHGTSFPLNESGLHTVFSHFIPNTTLVQQAMSLYPAGSVEYPTPTDAAAQFLTDWFFACGTRRTAVAAQSTSSSNVWLYHFSYKGHWLDFKLFGDYHSSELYFVWGNEYPKATWHAFNANDTALSNNFMSYWSSLAYNSQPNGVVPNGTTRANWLPFDPAALNLMDISGPDNTMSAQFRKKECDFWDTVPYV